MTLNPFNTFTENQISGLEKIKSQDEGDAETTVLVLLADESGCDLDNVWEGNVIVHSDNSL